MQLLKSQLYELEMKKRLEARSEIEAGKMKIEWGSQIRNYVMQPYQLVKDVRTGVETSAVQDVLNGQIDDFIKGYLMEHGKIKLECQSIPFTTIPDVERAVKRSQYLQEKGVNPDIIEYFKGGS